MSPVVDTSEPMQSGSGLELSVPIGAAPRLLVSVRNADEARAAIVGGTDLLDCKEPRRGSLGRPDANTIRQIILIRDEFAPQLPVSVALGELDEWRSVSTLSGADCLSGLTPNLVKVGLAGAARHRDWIDEWRRLRDRLDNGLARPAVHVAVCYADWQAAEAPCPDEVAAAAIASGCGGVLFDTCCKANGNLLSQLSFEALVTLLRTIRDAGLFTALAGGLRLTDLPVLTSLPCDILAVRGAVCETSDRTSPLSAIRVQALQQAIQNDFGCPRRARSPNSVL